MLLILLQHTQTQSLYLARPAHRALTERQAPQVGPAETQRRQRHRIATRATLRTRQVESVVPEVAVLVQVFPVVTEELAATPPQPDLVVLPPEN